MATTTMTAGDTANRTASSIVTPHGDSATELQAPTPSVQVADMAAQRLAKKTSQHALEDSNESTPIRHSDSHVDRNYSTSNIAVPTPAARPSSETGTVKRDSRASSAAAKEDQAPWYRRIAEKYGSITLENKGSVARDHLALERTFLAWLRTSLSFASIGIAITQLFRLNDSKPRSPTRKSLAMTEGIATSSDLPLSPFLGHTIPAEVLPYLEQILASSSLEVSMPALGPTLLDQVLRLSSDGKPVVSTGSLAVQVNTDASDKLRHIGKPLGATFIGISVAILLIGFQRYFEAQHWIVHGKFPASRGSISLVAFVALALIVASLVIVIAVSSTTYES